MRRTGRAGLALLAVLVAAILASGAALTAQTTAVDPPVSLPEAEKPDKELGIERPNPGLEPADPPKTKAP